MVSGGVSAVLALALPSIAHAAIDRAAFIALSSSVLKVEVIRTDDSYSLGSGVVVGPQQVVTNCHVTRDAKEISIMQAGLRWTVDLETSDVEHDLCLLRVPGMKAEPVAFGAAVSLKVGQPVTALGYTGGLGIQNSPGDVVLLHRFDGSNVIQSTNWFTSGASGGGMFDDSLKLVGILTFRLRGGEANYYAAPVEWVRNLLTGRLPSHRVMPLDANELSYWQRPVSSQPTFLQTAVLERDHRWKELEAMAVSWQAAAADDAEPWFLQGLACAETGRDADAEAALTTALRIEPKLVAAWFHLGMVYVRKGDLAKARDAQSHLATLNSYLSEDLGKAIDNG